MAKVKLGLFRLPVLEKIALANRIITAMTGNPNFVTPNPTLAVITAAKTALESAYNDTLTQRQQAKTSTEVLDDTEKATDLKLTQAAHYVENVSAGDEAKILSAGMSVKDAASPVGELPAPMGLYATSGDEDGEIVLNWEPVRGAKSYSVQMTTDPNVPESWAHKLNATESFTDVKGLTSGGKFWFKVAAVGAAGQGAFSDPAAKYAP